MDNDVKRTPKVPALMILASFIIVVAGMKAACSILVPFFLAVFVAVICTPPLFWLQRKGIPKVLTLSSVLTNAFFILQIDKNIWADKIKKKTQIDVVKPLIERVKPFWYTFHGWCEIQERRDLPWRRIKEIVGIF